jgi:hypothetical protein
MHDPNRALLERAADLLAPLAADLVYVGGCAAGLLITDTAAAGIRPTFDVDAIVQVASYADYDRLAARIRACGFTEAMNDAVMCRWRRGALMVDVMPTDAAVLGFTNRWYAEALAHATWVPLGTRDIRLITASYFLATKFEAFHDRGQADVRGSHDLEDIVAVIDGRPEVIDEVAHAPAAVREYVREQVRTLLATRTFHDALAGFLLPDDASQERLPNLGVRLEQLARLR